MRTAPFPTDALVAANLALNRGKIFQACKTSKNRRSEMSYGIRLLSVGAALLVTQATFADDLTTQSRAALRQLVAQNKAAATASSTALAVLVFPNVMKAGFIVGAHGGEGR